MAPPLPLDDKRTLQAIGILADALDELSADAPGRPVHLVFVGISYLACRLREEHEAGGIPHTQRGIQAHFIENADEADPTFPEGTGPR